MPNYPDMPGQEAVQMMKRCSSEIKDLHALVARLQPKADAYDNISIVLGLLPRPSQGYGEDLAWMLDKRIAEMAKPIEPLTESE